MMVYAIRTSASGRKTLIECEGDFETARYWAFISGVELQMTDDGSAHNWVKSGREHETGLFINDDGNIKYAEAEV